LRLRRLRLRLRGRRTLTGVQRLLTLAFQNLEILESMMDDVFKTYQHNPPHLFRPNSVYMLTASTYQKENIIHIPERKRQLKDSLFKAAELHKWQVIAWVILHNHYHVLVESPENALNLAKFVASYHKFTSRMWNKADKTPGRQVWWNYWDTCIRSEKDYGNRLGYIFWNPVKHGLAQSVEEYPFSSYQDYLKKDYGFDFTGWNEVNDVPEF
jgi:putative transposase